MKNKTLSFLIYGTGLFLGSFAVYIESNLLAVIAVFFGYVSGGIRCGGIATE